VRTITGTALVICLAACSAAGSTATQTQSATTAATGTPLASASASQPGGTVPDGFPVMPGADPVTPVPSEPGLLARWTTAANGSDVYDFYVDALPVAGFDVLGQFPGGAAAIIRFGTPDGTDLDVSLTANGDGTQIDLQVAEEG
jgi:hypothetical protein